MILLLRVHQIYVQDWKDNFGNVITTLNVIRPLLFKDIIKPLLLRDIERSLLFSDIYIIHRNYNLLNME